MKNECAQYGYTYKGYRYEPSDDVEYGDEGPENVKICHDVSGPGGEHLHMDFSPYNPPTMAEFDLWVELGMPERGNGPNLDGNDLVRMAKAKATALRAAEASFLLDLAEKI
jgi:hypothetical protein